MEEPQNRKGKLHGASEYQKLASQLEEEEEGVDSWVPNTSEEEKQIQRERETEERQLVQMKAIRCHGEASMVHLSSCSPRAQRYAKQHDRLPLTC